MPLKMPNGVIAEMIQEIKAYHRNLSDQYLQSLSPRRLLGYTHWIWREDYTKQLEKQGLIKTEKS